MPMKKLRTRTASTSDRAAFVATLDVEDPDTWPADLAPRQEAAIREAQREIEAAVEEWWEDTYRVLDESDTGMPPGRMLTGGGQVHTLYKRGGGYIRYLVPSSSTVTCAEVGCCDPRRMVSAGRD
jgi:hypothetical protein